MKLISGGVWRPCPEGVLVQDEFSGLSFYPFTSDLNMSRHKW